MGLVVDNYLTDGKIICQLQNSHVVINNKSIFSCENENLLVVDN